ncbi:uncharacterized protein LOC111913970 [Lactuca sativa]|uniref:Rab-GAP TBC domain-containing protein n=1 Tax=Lactuca sativa TaxID=4236 RepID=A0A9R1X5X1_LACSA|nr:uncharacterized protein LOC111913970 [Lactuca sativa]KAJ0197087.1 hypothetical protein LSAT_V11C700364800 [Lactuca sativa]
MSPAALAEPTTNTLPESSETPESSPERGDLDNNRRFWDLRGVQWRTDLGVLPSSSSIDEVRRVTANSRRSYATLRRRHLIDPLPKDGSNIPDLVMDNPLSQDPDSMWGRFFQKAEIEKMVDQDLSRLYPEHGSYFQTPGCQGVLRRILLLWCIRHPNHGYRQGMHELLAPLLYVLEADVERLSAVRKLYKHYFTDNFDGLSFHNTDSTYTQTSQHTDNNNEIQENQEPINTLDPKIQTIISFCDPYGAEGELGIVLSQKFMEHDAYCMFDALMSGNGGAVAMSNFFAPPPLSTQLPPVIEASSALYHLLAVVDPSLYTHFIELGVEPQYFALRWLRVLFGREFDLEDLLVIWDEIFSFDNKKLDGVENENDPETSFRVLNSTRGAFIAALAVSMILYIRSSVLSTETATSCLQRLLNFPKDVNLEKLVKKGKLLVPVAIAAMRSMPPPVDGGGGSGGYKMSKVTTGGKSHSYWEEKWRVLHKEEEKKVENKPKDWPEKVKVQLLRTESDPSSSKGFREKTIMSPGPGPARIGRHVRRSLLDDLARQLGLEEEPENCGNGGSEENSSIFSDVASPGGAANDNHHENETDRSSVASNLSVNEPETETETVTVPEVDSPETVAEVDSPEAVAGDAPVKVEENKDSAGKPGVNLKDRILSSGKLQWLWKFGKNGGEGSSEKGGGGGGVGGGDQKSEVAVDSGMDVRSKAESREQNKTCSLKNLGESMVENLQVIESVFQQEKEVDNMSKKALVDRGQMTAMAALKELRKISNILSEM